MADYVWKVRHVEKETIEKIKTHAKKRHLRIWQVIKEMADKLEEIK